MISTAVFFAHVVLPSEGAEISPPRRHARRQAHRQAGRHADMQTGRLARRRVHIVLEELLFYYPYIIYTPRSLLYLNIPNA